MARMFAVLIPFGIGAMFFLGSGSFFRETWSFVARSNTAHGKVVGRESPDGEGYFPVISFETPDGQKHKFLGSFTSFLSPKTGESVDVLYDPANPSRARVKGVFSLWLPTLLSGVIGIISLGAGVLMLVLQRSAGGARGATEREARPRAREPWSSRADWAQGRIASTTGLRGKWGCAIFLNLFIWAFAFIVWLVSTEGGEIPLRPGGAEMAGMFIVFIGVVIGVVYLGRAIGRTYQAARSGRSVFVMSAVPGVVGGSLRGVIHGRLRLRGDQGIRLILRNSVRETRSRADGTEVSTRVAWEDDRASPATEVTQAGEEALIPVQMAIPATCRETAEKVEIPGGDDSVSWTLEARAEPGHAWRAEFEVPVFRTEASAPPPQLPDIPAVRSMSLGEMARLGEELQQKARAVAGPTPRPFNSRIVVRPPTSEGVLIEYPAAFLFVAFAAWWLLTLPLYVVLPLDLLRLELMGPVASLALVAVLNGLPGYVMVYHWPRRLLIGPETITVFCGFPFFGARRRLPTSEAEKVSIGPQSLGILRKGKASLWQGGPYFPVSPPPASHAEGRWLAAEIEGALARYRGPR